MDNKEMYEKNLNHIRGLKAEYRNGLIAAIENSDDSSVVVCDNDIYILKEEHAWHLSSLYDSKRYAAAFAKDYEDMSPKSILFIFGFGEGDYIREILEAFNGAYVVCFEPNANWMKKLMGIRDLCDIFENDRFVLVCGEENILYYCEIIIAMVNYSNIKLNKYSILPNYAYLYPKEFKLVVGKYIDQIDSDVITRNTMILMGQERIENMLVNIPDFINQYNILDLIHNISGELNEDKYCILVSAGPSLDKNVHLLKEIKGKVPICAVDTALKPVIKSGCIPDFTITIDPHKPLSLFEIDEAKSLPMIVFLGSNAKINAIHQGKRVYFADQGDYIDEQNRETGRGYVPFETGGSVACNAFSILVTLGFKHIILIGQDLAYPNNQGHSKDSYDNEDNSKLKADGDKYFYVEDIYGNQVLTEVNMNSYRKWFENQIIRKPWVEVIDATEGGALINGSKIRTLREVIDGLNEKNYININKYFEELEKTFDEEAKKKKLEEFYAIGASLEEYREKIREGKKYYDRMLSLAAKGKTSGSEFRKCYNKISDVNKMVSENQIMRLVANYVANSEYEVLGEIYDYKENQSDKSRIKSCKRKR